MADNLDTLERLAVLYERGILTAAEFEAQKARLLQSNELHDLGSSQQGEVERSSSLSPRVITVVAICAALILLGFTVWQLKISASSEKISDRPAMHLPTSSLSSREIRFTDISQCAPSESFRAIIKELIGARDQAHDDPEPVLVKFSSGTEVQVLTDVSTATQVRTVIATASMEGSWAGLTPVQLKATRWPTGSGFQLKFSESSREAKTLLAGAGLDVGQVGTMVKRGGTMIGLEDLNSGSALTCLTSDVVSDSSELDAPTSTAN